MTASFQDLESKMKDHDNKNKQLSDNVKALHKANQVSNWRWGFDIHPPSQGDLQN